MIYIDGFTWRLGNQMFQLAAAINLAEENMDKVFYPEWKYAKYFQCDGSDFFNMETDLDGTPVTVYREPRFSYDQIPYRRNMSINGYFQSEKYFKNSARLIRKMFKLKPEYRFDNEPHTCSIHVRRTDYIDLNTHFHTLTVDDYYQKAMDWMEIFTARIDKFYVFSDDIEWCKANFRTDWSDDKVVFYEGKDEIQDFAKMQSCQYNIIANSSYSWWAAWLNDNPDKLVYAPSHDKWFGPALAQHDTKDLIPESWTRL